MGIIVKPIVTEKAATQEENGVYGFMVDPSANKIEIKKAIESKYSVSIDSVRTMNYAGKRKRNRKTWQLDGKTPAFKKAFVKVKEGEVIDIYGNI